MSSSPSDIWTILGSVLVVLSVIYLGSWLFGGSSVRLKPSVEGMSNNSTGITGASGEGGSAASYGAAIKSKTIEMQDALIVNKYRENYETALINLDTFIGTMILRQALNMNVSAADPADMAEPMARLAALTNAKTALNIAMQTLDAI